MIRVGSKLCRTMALQVLKNSGLLFVPREKDLFSSYGPFLNYRAGRSNGEE